MLSSIKKTPERGLTNPEGFLVSLWDIRTPVAASGGPHTFWCA